MTIESGPQFLKEQYNLHNEPEVEAAVKRAESRTGKKVPPKSGAQIQTYLDRLEHVFDPDPLKGHESFDRQARNLSLLKQGIYKQFVINPEDVPEAAFLAEQRIARELGHGDVEITDEFKEKKTAQIISDQETSLDRWLEYLTSDDALYPTWAKYWAVRSVLSMGKLKKEESDDGSERVRFQKRAKDTIAPFPILNSRALALTIGAITQQREEKGKPKTERETVTNVSTKLTDDEFQQLLSVENFSRLYTQFLTEIPEYSQAGLNEIRGVWKTYPQGSAPDELVASLENYPLEWCTANKDTAQSQLEGGDFHVYYSLNEDGAAVIPRVAIRMQDKSIAEVRGIAPNQNIDPYIAPVVQKKMAEFPDGAAYEKKSQDMSRLTQMERKVKVGQPLNKDDLIFLYEIDGTIEGFGYQRDPRVAELRELRDPLADAPIVFECTLEQIAHTTSEITPNTKAYIGKLEPGIFDRIQQNHIEHIFTSFPEGKIARSELTIGGQTVEQLEAKLRAQNINISSYAEGMLHSPDFTTLPEPEQIDLVRLRVDALLDGYPTTDQLYARAQELGLEPCPAEVGPHQRLMDTDQSLGEWYRIAMKQIADRYGSPNIFNLGRRGGGLWLIDSWAEPMLKWDPDDQSMFRLRKQSLET